MKDEIKEILESLDKIAKAEYYPEDLLTYKECQLLLDYITNLQEERNMFKDSFETMSKNYFEEKSRNEKAIEKLNTVDFDEFIYTKQGLKNIKKDLLNILQGSDKDE